MIAFSVFFSVQECYRLLTDLLLKHLILDILNLINPTSKQFFYIHWKSLAKLSSSKPYHKNIKIYVTMVLTSGKNEKRVNVKFSLRIL